MANYSYDESGNMAAYFLLTCLCIILIPLSISAVPSRKSQKLTGCQCHLCAQQRESIRKREGGSIFTPNLRPKTLTILAGWALVAFLIYKITDAPLTDKVYDPFEILGISTGTTIKEIKSHYKKLSRTFHPDKVKLGVNDTIEAVEAKFVEITKAYKSLTDETIRKNWEQYGHPDGRQEVSMGIALPKWIVESGNNIWVLGAYGLLFGGALPALVGQWWFGNRQKTKDGVNARSAAAFFKSLSEDAGYEEVISALGKTFEWERPVKSKGRDAALDELEGKIKEQLGTKWNELKKLAEVMPGKHETRRRAFVLLYAHLLRLAVGNSTLVKEQAQLLLQTPTLLNSMLNISVSRNWLNPTLAAMRLHAYLAQALPPRPDANADQLRIAALPDITLDEAAQLASKHSGFTDAVRALEAEGGARGVEVRKAAERWGGVEILDAGFKVIGERFVTPASIVYMVARLRLRPSTAEGETANGAEESRDVEEEFLTGKKDAEDIPPSEANGFAHAPYWPANRKPGWWIVLADAKMGKVIMPPLRITDVPVGGRGRRFKMQFQAPQTVGMFTWRAYIVSDTFVGEEAWRDLVLRIEDPSVLATDDAAEDEISEPEEDSLAGQMAMMRGGSVRKHAEGESDDESSTDDDEKKGDDSDSSDSD